MSGARLAPCGYACMHGCSLIGLSGDQRLFSLATRLTSTKRAARNKPDATETICATQTTAKCHTALMAFHETFWVVTGTAAPVIALAAVVSAGDADEQVDRM